MHSSHATFSFTPPPPSAAEDDDDDDDVVEFAQQEETAMHMSGNSGTTLEYGITNSHPDDMASQAQLERNDRRSSPNSRQDNSVHTPSLGSYPDA